MNRKEVDRIIADNQQSDLLFKDTAKKVNRIVENYTEVIIACVTKYDLPKDVENQLIGVASACNTLAGSYSTCVDDGIFCRSRFKAILEHSHAMNAVNEDLRKENTILLQGFQQLAGLSIWKFFLRKISLRRLKTLRELKVIKKGAEDRLKFLQVQLDIINQHRGDSGKGEIK